MDFGTADKNLQFHLRREFYAKHAVGLEVNKYKLDPCEEALAALQTLRDD